MDTLSKVKRSNHMARIRRQDTKPERVVSAISRALGYRFGKHKKDLPGTPDLVFASRKKVIFVHGCFWHRHQCKRATMPASNRAFWRAKFIANVERDKRQRRAIRAAGWKVLVVWECQTKRTEYLRNKLKEFLKA